MKLEIKNIMRFKIIFLSILIVGFIACRKHGKPTDFDYGKVTNNVYSNAFFHFEMTLPAEWNVLPRNEAEAQQKQGMKVIAGSNEDMKRAVEKSEVNTANLLSVFQYRMEDLSVTFNPSLIMVAEKVSETRSIKSAADYLSQSRKALLQTPISFNSISAGNEMERIGGQLFSKMHVVINGENGKIHQTYYCFISEGYALCIVLSYVNDEQKQWLLNSVKSIRFLN